MRTLNEILKDELQASHPILLESKFDELEPLELPQYETEDMIYA